MTSAPAAALSARIALGSETGFESCGGLCGGARWIGALLNENGALLRSKAGERSTSLGIMPLFKREYIPSAISFSVMGGGSANGSSLKCFGRMRFAEQVFSACRAPIPSFSSSTLLIPP